MKEDEKARLELKEYRCSNEIEERKMAREAFCAKIEEIKKIELEKFKLIMDAFKQR